MANTLDIQDLTLQKAIEVCSLLIGHVSGINCQGCQVGLSFQKGPGRTLFYH